MTQKSSIFVYFISKSFFLLCVIFLSQAEVCLPLSLPSASTIPGAYHTLGDYMRTNGLVHVEDEVIPCFETAGESMDVYLACK